MDRFDSHDAGDVDRIGHGFTSAKLLLGDATGFHAVDIASPDLVHAPLVIAVGVVTGLRGVAYNRALLFGLRIADISRWPVETRAALIGGMVGWVAPSLVGGGENLTQEALLSPGALAGSCTLLVVRLVLGVVSYAAATPGGMFAPKLVLGSQAGLVVGLLADQLAPGYAPEPAALALIRMAAFFTATVRAPITGIVLATELTGETSVLPPMLGACAVAMLVNAPGRGAPRLRREPRTAAPARSPSRGNGRTTSRSADRMRRPRCHGRGRRRREDAGGRGSGRQQ